jgi:hypothetical protein
MRLGRPVIGVNLLGGTALVPACFSIAKPGKFVSASLVEAAEQQEMSGLQPEAAAARAR